MKKHVAAILALCLCSAAAVHAQGMGGMAPAAVGPIDPATSMDASVSNLEKLITGAAKAMPADKYSFAPSAAIFVPSQTVKFDGVRTYAQIMTHTIQANYRYFSMISGLKPDADMKALGDLKTKDEILTALAATFVFAHKAVATVTTANAFDGIKTPMGTMTRVTAFAAAIAHAEDEYGQAVEYLRMNAIIPPASVKSM